MDRRDNRITRYSDDRYGMVKFVRDVGLAAVRGERNAEGPLPTEIVAVTAFVAVSMIDTVLFKFVT